MSSVISHFYRFGDFSVDTDQRVLMRDGKPVAITPKVFETLLVLIENRGRILEKDELMNRLWRDSFVEEANLAFNIQQLRKALGDNARKPVYIETVARRGYRFIADVEELLNDTSVMHGQLNVRLSGFDTEKEKHEPVIVNQPKFEPQPVKTEIQIISSFASIAKGRTFFIAAGLLVIIWGIGLFVWQFGNASSRQQRENNKTEFSSHASSLKFEKLTATGKSSNPVISPDGRFVAYINETKGQYGIWLRQLATNTSRQILPASDEIIGGLKFAQSGESLFFARTEGGKQFTLYRVPLIGGLPTRLIPKVQGTFSISPDDNQVAFIRYSDDDKKCALMIVNADGNNERALVIHEQPDRFNAPAWSPDGKSIAVAVGASDSGGQEVRIIEINVADSSERELSADRWFHVKRLEWLAENSVLIVCGSKKVGEASQLWRISYPAGNVSQITEGLASYQNISITADANKAVASQVSLVSDIWVGSKDEIQNLKRITQATSSFVWTSDGQIVYASNVSVNSNLWIMKPDGTEQRQLTNTGYNGMPVVSSDGRYIIFTSNRTGSLQAWRMNSDGSNQIQLTNVKGGTHTLSISPDGQWVVYHVGDSRQLWKVSIDGGESVRLTENPSICPSVSPDGKLIAFFGRDDKYNHRLSIIPFDGGKPLKEFDFATSQVAATRLQWTPDGRALIYAASSDRLKSLYKQSLDGGTPEKLTDLNEDEIFDFGYSHDGSYFAAIRGNWLYDVVLITHFK